MLNYETLYNGFLNIFDRQEEYTDNLQIVCQRWTDVFKNFYLEQNLPISGSLNPKLQFSLREFELGMLSAIKSQTLHIQFENLIRNLHFNICRGVDMTGNYVTTPPSSLLILKKYFDYNLSTKNIANKLSSTIFNWVLLTFSIQNTSGVIIKWM